jgi:hypothetical protein
MGMCKWLCVATPSPSLNFFQHQQIVYWFQYIFQHPVIWLPRCEGGRGRNCSQRPYPAGYEKGENRRTNWIHTSHTPKSAVGTMSFLGVLEVTLQCFPPNSEQDFHGGNGREGQGRWAFLLLLPCEITLLPPQILNSIFELMIAINQCALVSFLFQLNWNAYSQIGFSFFL